MGVQFERSRVDLPASSGMRWNHPPMPSCVHLRFIEATSLSLRPIIEGLHCDLGPLESRLAAVHCNRLPRTSRTPLNRQTSSKIATQFDLPVARLGSLLREVEGCSVIIRLDDPKTRHEFGPVVERSGTEGIRTVAVVDELRVAWGLDPPAALRVRQNQAIEADRLGGGWIRDLHVASVDRSRGDNLPIDQVRRGLKHQRAVGWALQPQSEALRGCT